MKRDYEEPVVENGDRFKWADMLECDPDWQEIAAKMRELPYLPLHYADEAERLHTPNDNH